MHELTLVFDFDSTIVSIESLEVLGAYALRENPEKEVLVAEMQRITNLGMDGTIPYEESLSKRMSMLSLHRDDIVNFAPKMTSYISSSFLAHKDFFTNKAHAVYVVSGGFEELIFPVTDMLGIPRDHIFANVFVYNDDGSVSGVDTMRPTSRKGGKAEQIKNIPHTGKVIMVGDGMTDYDARKLGIADIFVAYTEHIERPPVVAVADSEVKSFDQLLGLL